MPLKARLIEDGFSHREIAAAFQPQPVPLYKTIAQTFTIREGRLNYDQFLAPSALAKARQFAKIHEHTLHKAEEKTGVDRSVIVAILLVETQLGHYTGRVPTLAVLSTFALMDQKSSRDKIWAMLPAREKTHWGREAVDRKLIQRSQWAYQEVHALLQLARQEGTKVETLQGSIMGAIGWPQFLPSSFIRYGLDGNQDGRINLYHPEDAIFSIANYLKGHGWRPNSGRVQQEEAIHAYNHSQPYVQTVLEVAERLR